MARLIDFSNCPVIPGQAYNGANGKKIAVEYQGQQYMLKFPPLWGEQADGAVLYQQLYQRVFGQQYLQFAGYHGPGNPAGNL